MLFSHEERDRRQICTTIKTTRCKCLWLAHRVQLTLCSLTSQPLPLARSWCVWVWCNSEPLKGAPFCFCAHSSSWKQRHREVHILILISVKDPFKNHDYIQNHWKCRISGYIRKIQVFALASDSIGIINRIRSVASAKMIFMFYIMAL